MSSEKTATLKCPICEKMLSKIDKQHLRKHGLTLEEYKIQYPSAPLGYSDELKAAKSGVNHPSTGKKRTTEQRANISIGTKKMWETYTPSEAQISHAKTMGFKDGVSVNVGKKHIWSEERKLKSSINALGRFRSEPTEGEHFWCIRNIMSKWATFDEACDPLHFDYVCKTCGTPGNSSLSYMHRQSYAHTLCKVCYPTSITSSKAEIELRDFIRLEFDLVVIPNDKTLLGNAGEIDIFIPSLNVGIEYHGLYWHSRNQLKDVYRHRRKYEEATKLGIRLIQIFEDEWLQKKDIVKARLRSILGSKPDKIFYARKLKIKKLKYGATVDFLNENHLQGGKIKTNKNYALVDKNENIISMMSFSKPRVSMNHRLTEGVNKLELVRYATCKNLVVVGGTEKILKNAILLEQPDIIESWADLRYVNPVNNVYLKNGFTFKSDSKLGYFYTDFINRFHRFGFMKPKDAPAELNEEEYWASKKIYRIFDCGQILYELVIKKN